MKIVIDRLSPPSLEVLQSIAANQVKLLPPIFYPHVQGLVIRVDEFPDDETMAELGLESEFDLLGLYRGVALADKSVINSATDVDMIFLYRRAILDYWCETDEDLSHLVRHVLIHEIGHHFGFSDDDMERIENTPELA
ncbi:MAG: metallopeptidase family protein [Rhodospirillaceae bacterium]|nr:metallopeptidase family protein [Rhodospirillaceae bacterium]